METWVKDIIGLSIAFDIIVLIGIGVYITIKYWDYDWNAYKSLDSRSTYKSYNYNYTVNDKEVLNNE
jgi:hypothetical protein